MRALPKPDYRRVTLQGHEHGSAAAAIRELRRLLERDKIEPDDIWADETSPGWWIAQADIPDVHIHAWARKDGEWWCGSGDHGYDGPQPVARSTDPQTSWDAARSVDNLTETRLAILGVLRQHGPQTDEEIAHLFSPEEMRRMKTSPSGLRTRRSELVHDGHVFDSGKRKVGDTGRKMIVWEARGGDQR